jgi:NAD(P)-dependent dehydrogenase (short-subunit alcohol dehydrogenase family)
VRHVLVTGANRGLGLELTRQCLTRGDYVFAGCRKPARAAALQSLATLYEGRLTLLVLDVTDEETLDASREIVSARTEALDLLFNNAAIHPGDEAITDLNAETLIHTFRVNAVGPMIVARCYLDLLNAADPAKIINISSEAGSISRMQHHRGYAYYASKAALNMLTRALAWEKKLSGVIAVAIHPGWVRTDMGGDHAPLSPVDSVAGILRVVDGLDSASSGRFYTYEGDQYPW